MDNLLIWKLMDEKIVKDEILASLVLRKGLTYKKK